METSNKILEQLRFIVYDVYDVNKSSFRVEPLGGYPLLLEDKRRLKLACSIVSLVLNSGIIHRETIEYILNKDMDVERVIELIFVKYNRRVTLVNMRQLLHQDRKKLLEIFGDRIFFDLTVYRENDISEYERIVKSELEKRDSKGMLNNCVLDLKSKSSYNYEITDEEFDKFISTIKPFTVSNIKKVNDKLDERVLGYVNYITSGNEISSSDSKRLEKLRKILIKG